MVLLHRLLGRSSIWQKNRAVGQLLSSHEIYAGVVLTSRRHSMRIPWETRRVGVEQAWRAGKDGHEVTIFFRVSCRTTITIEPNVLLFMFFLKLLCSSPYVYTLVSRTYYNTSK